jgi:hypothetical protein
MFLHPFIPMLKANRSKNGNRVLTMLKLWNGRVFRANYIYTWRQAGLDMVSHIWAERFRQATYADMCARNEYQQAKILQFGWWPWVPCCEIYCQTESEYPSFAPKIQNSPKLGVVSYVREHPTNSENVCKKER